MDYVSFPSLAKPAEIMYVWQRSSYDVPWQFDHRGFKDNAAWWQTYGDGQTQHSPQAPVSVDSALDYLASLASYLAENHDTETLECIANDWPYPECHVGRDEVKFCLDMKHKDNGVTRYYNQSDRKISSADSKQHDKRWAEIVQWMDGTIKAALSLCRPSYYLPLDSYSLCEFVEQTAREEHGSTYSNLSTAELAGFVEEDGDWHAYNQYANNLASAFNSVDHFVRSHRALDSALRSWGCLQNNYVRNVLEREETEVAD